MSSVLERKVFHAGKPLVIASENHSNAYMIQSGAIAAYAIQGKEKVQVNSYSKGAIVGEMHLLLDLPSPVTLEATTDTTVIVIPRQEFEKKLKKTDPALTNIIETLIKKLRNYEEEHMKSILEDKNIDEKAFQIVSHLLSDMNDQRKYKYEQALLPPFNQIVRSLDEIRKEERHARQKENLEVKVAEVKGEGGEESDEETAE